MNGRNIWNKISKNQSVLVGSIPQQVSTASKLLFSWHHQPGIITPLIRLLHIARPLDPSVTPEGTDNVSTLKHQLFLLSAISSMYLCFLNSQKQQDNALRLRSHMDSTSLRRNDRTHKNILIILQCFNTLS